MSTVSRAGAILCLLSCVVMASISCVEDAPVPNPLLSDYPAFFGSETIIVIPENASPVMAEGAGEIALNLEQLTDDEPEIKSDTELTQNHRASSNLILMLAPGSGSLLEEVCSLTGVRMVTEQYPGENKGILRILRSPWNQDRVVLMVCGSDEPGLGAAIEFLIKDEATRNLIEEQAVVQFDNGGAVMIPVDMLNSVMEYIRQHHSDAAEFIGEDISWSRIDQTFREGYTRNVYSGDGWTVVVGLTIVPGAFYEVRAEHSGARVVWVGTIEDGSISEASYKSNV